MWLHSYSSRVTRSAATGIIIIASLFLGFAGLRLVPVATAATSGTWSDTTPMSIPRSRFASAILQDGRVLVAGGVTYIGQGSGPTNTAEIYDPTTHTWSPTGNMLQHLAAQTMTTLQDGLVLVAGGQCFNPDANCPPSGVSAEAELYDPGTGTWSQTGNLNVTRDLHTATLLPDGRVLVAGGYNGNNTGATSEIYDPGTGTWTLAGSMSSPRYVAAAVLLPDGSVLMTGGFNDSGFAPSYTEIFDSNTGLWQTGSSLTTTRSYHTATVLADGSVLVAGGFIPSSVSNPNGVSNTSEIRDPVRGTWKKTHGKMNSIHLWGTATVLNDGEVLVAGCAGSGACTGVVTTEVYNPKNQQWSVAGDLSTSRGVQIAAKLPDGTVLIAGGETQNGVDATFLSSAEMFTP